VDSLSFVSWSEVGVSPNVAMIDAPVRHSTQQESHLTGILNEFRFDRGRDDVFVSFPPENTVHTRNYMKSTHVPFELSSLQGAEAPVPTLWQP
jgi:hypothetical protein